jgi:hypothetical protein
VTPALAWQQRRAGPEAATESPASGATSGTIQSLRENCVAPLGQRSSARSTSLRGRRPRRCTQACQESGSCRSGTESTLRPAATLRADLLSGTNERERAELELAQWVDRASVMTKTLPRALAQAVHQRWIQADRNRSGAANSEPSTCPRSDVLNMYRDLVFKRYAVTME